MLNIQETISLDPAIKSDLKLLQIFIILNSISENSYLVGGCVRDMLLGKIPHDFDIVTDVTMDIMKEAFIGNGWRVDAVGEQFLILFISKDDIHFEIANFRKDSEYSDGRRPDKAEIGDLTTDSERRDFTINSIYYNPMKGSFLDPNNGKKDIEDRLLRFIGRPEHRIKEDHLRLWRLIRFKAQLGFEIEKETFKALKRYFPEYYLKQNPARVLQEILKM